MEDSTDPLDPTTVYDRGSFLAFVRALAADYRRCGPSGPMACPDLPSPYAGLWHNLDLGEFLASGVDWAEQLGSADNDFPGTEADFPSQPTWQAFAVFLFQCKSYYPGRDT